MPVHIVERMQKLNRTERVLLMELGREPTLAEVAERADLPLGQALEVTAGARASRSLDQPLGAQDGAVFGDLVADEGPLPDERVEDTLRNEALAEALTVLGERERTVITLRYGLHGSEPKKLGEIGREDVVLNLTRRSQKPGIAVEFGRSPRSCFAPRERPPGALSSLLHLKRSWSRRAPKRASLWLSPSDDSHGCHDCYGDEDHDAPAIVEVGILNPSG
jgi:Sigma-70 region 3